MVVGTGYGATVEVRKKGPAGAYAVRAAQQFLEEAGVNSGATFRGEAENALLDFTHTAAQSRRAKTILQKAPAGPHASVGAAERLAAPFRNWLGRCGQQLGRATTFRS